MILIPRGKLDCILQNGGKKHYVWNSGVPLGYLLMLPCPVNKVKGKLQQPNPDTMTKGKDTSKMKVLFTPPGKEQRYAEGEGNLEWVKLKTS